MSENRVTYEPFGWGVGGEVAGIVGRGCEEANAVELAPMIPHEQQQRFAP